MDPRVVPIGDPLLGTVEHPSIAVELGRRRQGGHVAPATGFGERPGAQILSRCQRGKVLLPLLLVRGDQQVGAAQGTMSVKQKRRGSAMPGDLLHDDRGCQIAETRSAVFSRNEDAQESHVGEFGDKLPGDVRLAIPLPGVWGDVVGGKTSGHVLKGYKVFGKFKVHRLVILAA